MLSCLSGVCVFSHTEQEAYTKLTEEDILAVLMEQILSQDEFSELKTRLITNLFSEMKKS